MKYLRGFFKKDTLLSKEDVEMIEDIFLSYIEEANNTFAKKIPFSKFTVSELQSFNGNQEDLINFYYFNNVHTADLALHINKKIIISIWSPHDSAVRDILERYKNRIEKFGFNAKIKFKVNAKSGEDRYGKHGGSYYVVEHIIIISKKII